MNIQMAPKWGLFGAVHGTCAWCYRFSSVLMNTSLTSEIYYISQTYCHWLSRKCSFQEQSKRDGNPLVFSKVSAISKISIRKFSKFSMRNFSYGGGGMEYFEVIKFEIRKKFFGLGGAVTLRWTILNSKFPPKFSITRLISKGERATLSCLYLKSKEITSVCPQPTSGEHLGIYWGFFTIFWSKQPVLSITDSLLRGDYVIVKW